MDIRNAYPVNTGINQWQRTVSMIKTGRIEVTDRYNLKIAANNIEQTFMTVCPTDVTHPGKIFFTLPNKKVVTLDYDAKYWEIKKQKMELDSPEDQGLKTSWDHQDIYRLLLVAKSPSAKAIIKYSIYK